MSTFDTPTQLAASAARTTSGASAAMELSNARRVAVLVDVTAVSGTTPSMTVTVEWSHDGATWFTADPADGMTAITAASKVVKAFDVKAPQCRLVWTITGTTPSFTFAARAYDF